MEGNRDEAERCIEIAKQAIQDSKLDRAEKFLKKAEALFPTPRAKNLLEKLSEKMKDKKDDVKQTSGVENVRHRKGGKESDIKVDNQKPTEPEYTSEQLECVKRIKKCKDYYEVLSVTKEATDSDVKKAYKKLALQLHPDKNKAPGALEAFKAVGNAVAILTDAEKRKSYDLYGDDDQRVRRPGTHRHNYEYGYSRGFEADMTAEELFQMFFGGGMPTQNVYMRQRRFTRTETHDHHREQQSGYAALINLLPILLLISLSMMSSFFISDPIYSLTPSQKYSIERRTNSLKIPYYVKDSFHTEYQGSVGRLELSVEEEFMTNLKHACYRERNYKESMLMKARNFNDRDMYRRAQSITVPSCDSYQKYQKQ